MFTKILATEAAMCPNCGTATLTLQVRQVNVHEYVCTSCDKVYSYEYIAGHIAGAVYARGKQAQP